MIEPAESEVAQAPVPDQHADRMTTAALEAFDTELAALRRAFEAKVAEQEAAHRATLAEDAARRETEWHGLRELWQAQQQALLDQHRAATSEHMGEVAAQIKQFRELVAAGTAEAVTAREAAVADMLRARDAEMAAASAKWAQSLASEVAAIKTAFETRQGIVSADWDKALAAATTLATERFESVHQSAVDRYNQELAKATAQFTAQQARLDTAISNFQDNVGKLLDSQREQFAAERQAREAASDAAVKAQETEFTANESARRADHDATRQQQLESWGVLLKRVAAEREEQQRVAAETTSNLLNSIKADQKRAEELLNIVVATTMSGAYEKKALAAKAQADKWRTGGVWAFACWCSFAIYLTYELVGQSNGSAFSWPMLVGRILVAAVLGTATSYVVSRSTRFELAQRRYEQTALELAAIDPYIQSLPEATRVEVKQKLAERLFGQHDYILKDSTYLPTHKVLNASASAVKAVADSVRK